MYVYIHTISPALVYGRLLAEFLGEVIESLQTANLVKEPFLVSFLRPLQVVPRPINVLQT